MDSETNPTPTLTPEKCVTVWNTVTPLSKYLAMTLFIALPFIGGWIGYRFASENTVIIESTQPTKVVGEGLETGTTDVLEAAHSLNPKEPSDVSPILSMYTNESGSLTCSHSHLNNITKESYDDWPVYTDTHYGVSFVYPPQQQPNVEERFSHGGVDYLRVGFNPNLTPEFSGLGKPYLHGFNDTWQVDIHLGSGEAGVGADYCAGPDVYGWCILEELKQENTFKRYVSSMQYLGMLDTEERRYYLYSEDGLLAEVYMPAATRGGGSPCSIVFSVFNIDLIAHSVRRTF